MSRLDHEHSVVVVLRDIRDQQKTALLTFQCGGEFTNST